MIDIKSLTKNDVGRSVTFHMEFCDEEHGTLSSCNDVFIFVKFKGINGEAFRPEDVTFYFSNEGDN